MLQAVPSTPLPPIHLDGGGGNVTTTNFIKDNNIKIYPTTIAAAGNDRNMMDLKVNFVLNNDIDYNSKSNNKNNNIPSQANWNNDLKTKKLVMEKKKSAAHRLSSPLSTTMTTITSAVSNSNISTSAPSSPQPFLNSARSHSFSSSQSFQSTLSSGGDQLLNHSHLKPGENASLLSYSKTINLYRENAKKTNNMEIQCDFAVFLVEAAKRLSQKNSSIGSSAISSNTATTDGSVVASMDNEEEEQQQDQQQQAYILEAEKLLKQVAVRGHSESQYYLANMYAAGLLWKRGQQEKPDFDKAFPLFVQSAKHHHPDAAYRAAKCYEDGLGTRKDRAKAVQYYRKAATLNHPGSMYRLGLAEMKGDLGLSRNIRDGHKWLKRSAEAATAQYPHALHELALLHEKGLDSIIFADLPYAVSLYHEAAVLGYAPSAYRLGECYEFGKLDCQPDASLSIQYYSIAAEQNHPEACFALTAWYLVGVPNLLPPSDEQAYAWAMCAAQSGLPRAEYAVGYFTEMGIGIMKDENVALEWYKKAAQHGEKRAIQRLQPFDHTNIGQPDGGSNKKKKKSNTGVSKVAIATSSSKASVSKQKLPKPTTEVPPPIDKTSSRKRMSFLSLNSCTSTSNQTTSNSSRQNSFLYKATSFLRRPSSLQ